MVQFVDVDYAVEKMARGYHSVILIHINRSPIIWYIKKHKTFQSSTFGSEIVAFRAGLDITKGLR